MAQPLRALRIWFWAAAVLLGGAETWYTRHRIFSDGVSYITIARQYASGDWHGALNAYWSPLYSWLLAIYLVIFQPSQYWEASSMHVINFGAFLLSCFFFEKLLSELIRQRPGSGRGFSILTLWMAGYLSILQGGLWLIGIGYNSPDLVAYGLVAVAAWLTLRVARGERRMGEFIGLGAVLGLGYLDRTAFAPLCAVYLMVMWFLVRQWKPLLVSAVVMAAISAPFATAISLKTGTLTMGESGKLNYGWEVDGAVRSTHWQGEPGDLGVPVHPTRVLIKEPVPVYEFATPVAGAYAPWYDPSYWYQGIRPNLKPARQIRAVLINLRTSVYHLVLSSGFLILLMAIVFSRGLALQPMRWPLACWAILVPALAGTGMYCLVFVDRRYIAGFLVLLWMTPLAAAALKPGIWRRRLDLAARMTCVAFALFLLFKLRFDLKASASDLIHRREGEGNIQWMLAQKFERIGIKSADKIAYIGFGIDADWVRLVGAKIVAETPNTYDRGLGLTNFLDVNESYLKRFFQLDEASREKVYAAYRQAGATIVVANRIPKGSLPIDWVRALDPDDPKYPHSDAQTPQEASYYRWLEPAHNSGAY